jgi:hypothetical protein
MQGPRTTGGRRVLAMPAATATLTVAVPAPRVAPRSLVEPALADPVARGYRHLDVVQDAHQRGSEPRLLPAAESRPVAYVRDNALAVLAYLACPDVANVRRARLVGDALLRAQAGGRLCAAYGPGLRPADGGSPTAALAWAGIALAQLYVDTRIPKYLDGALDVGRWVAGQRSPHRHGGYHGGLCRDGVTPRRWAATGDNIDAYALFALLAKLTRDRRWHGPAAVAAAFVAAMWDRQERLLRAGTPADDPDRADPAAAPGDVQARALLGLGERRYEAALDRAAAPPHPPAAAVADGTNPGSAGPAPGNEPAAVPGAATGPGPGPGPDDQTGVAAVAALALLARNAVGDVAVARRLLREDAAALEAGAPRGVVATSWLLLAAQNVNPYR